MAKFPYYNSSHQQWNLDQRVVVIPPPSCKKMFGWVVRTHHPIIKLVFWKLLEKRVFLWECCSMIFIKDAYCLAGCLLECLPSWESPQSLYISQKVWPRLLTGPIVMIMAHRRQSNHDISGARWHFWCQVAFLVPGGGCQENIQEVDVTSIYDCKYRGCVRHSEKI